VPAGVVLVVPAGVVSVITVILILEAVLGADLEAMAVWYFNFS